MPYSSGINYSDLAANSGIFLLQVGMHRDVKPPVTPTNEYQGLCLLKFV